MKLVSQEKISLKNHPEINERAIQDYIFENPSVLGIGVGELVPLIKEKKQPQGGRLDMLFKDDDENRYEVELQLGATDPSHIIRTLEYWDTEKKRYQQYNHTAVIIAEDITSRFQNVISLFNGSIPIVALQLQANKTNDGEVALSFVKIMDVIEPGNDEEEESEPATRAYWEKNSTNKMMALVDQLSDAIGIKENGYDLKYNKYYIGLQMDGVTKNYISFKPKKSFAHIEIKSDEIQEISERLINNGLELKYKWKKYIIRLNNFDDFENNKNDLLTLIDNAKERYDVE